jgi:hypothetical protein
VTKEIKVGDMIRFDRINGHTRDINDKVGLYLGIRPIYRDDGRAINNFMVLLHGESVPRLCDQTMMQWVKHYESR